MAGASQTQTDRQICCLQSLSSASQAMTSCGASRYCLVRVVYPFHQSAERRRAGFENKKMHFTRRELAFDFSTARESQQKIKQTSSGSDSFIVVLLPGLGEARLEARRSPWLRARQATAGLNPGQRRRGRRHTQTQAMQEVMSGVISEGWRDRTSSL